MSKITRIFHKIFGGSAISDMGVYGSLKNGSPDIASDASTIQSTTNWLQGLAGAMIGNNAIAKEDMNSALYHSSREIGYLMQEGIAEWNAQTVYYIDSICNDHGQIFISTIDSNINHPPLSEEASQLLMSWKRASDHRVIQCASTVSTIADATTVAQKIIYDVVVSDELSEVSASSTTFSFNPKENGQYTITPYFAVLAGDTPYWKDTDQVTLMIYKNGSIECYVDLKNPHADERVVLLHGSKTIELEVQDVVDVRYVMSRVDGATRAMTGFAKLTIVKE